MVLVNLILAIVVIILFVMVFYLRRILVTEKKREADYIKELEFSRKQLQDHLSSLDVLLTMLVGLHQSGINITTSSQREEFYQMILSDACRLLNTDSGSLMMLEPSTNELSIVAAIGLSSEVVHNTRVRLGEGIAGKVAENGKAVFVDNIEDDQRFLRESNHSYATKSFISVPVKTKTRILGVLNVSGKSIRKEYEERDRRLLTMLCDQSAIILENSELYENLQKFYWDMIQTLARAIDAKDSYTREHADRSVHYARAISREMNLSAVMAKNIEYAALMHDIGKIGIEEQILHKAGKLSLEEFEIIKQHPRIGNRIISPVPFLSEVAPMILYHHEWYNGEGYLEGLAGEEIPLGARIIAIIDAYDAMTSDRPYRKALPKDKAVEEIKRGAGIQFDPNVVEAFLRVLEKEKI